MTHRRVLTATGVWGVLMALLWVSRSRPAVFVLGGVVAVASAVILVMVDFNRTITQVRWTKRTDQPQLTRDHDSRVSSLRHQVRGAWKTGSTQLALVDLVDDRLSAHHHIDRSANPAGADELLTPSLRRLVAGPRRQTATVRELRQILTEIEAL